MDFLNKTMRILMIANLVFVISACGGGSGSDSPGEEITVEDTESPTITLTGADDIMLAIGGIYTDAGATAEDNVDDSITVVTTGTVDTTTVGSYTITYSASDAAGNTATEVTRTVVVKAAEPASVADITPPTIMLTGVNEITITAGDTYADAGATANDVVDGTVEVTKSGTVDNSTVGSYVLTYNAVDAAGNNASPVTRTINVVAAAEDTTSPVLSLNGNSEIIINVGDTFTDPGATVTDNTDASTTVYSSNSVITTTANVYTLTYSAVDSAGNAALPITRIVTVQVATALKGVFEDSRVINLSYETPTLSGETNDQGEFEYMTGETITFNVGDIILGSAPGAEKITTFDVGDSLEKDPVTGEYNDVNRAILLQSLDKNKNPADGFIDLTGVVANLNSGVNIEDGVTQGELDIITGGTSSAPLVSSSEAVAHADIAKNDAFVEEGGVLKFNTILTQEDIDAGNYRVQSRVGNEFIANEPTSSTPIVSIESDLKVLSQQGLDEGRLRNSIVIDNSTDTYYLGLGIRFRDGEFGLNYYVERYGKGSYSSEYENIQAEVLPAINDVVIEVNKTYNFKLEYDVSLDKVYGYIDTVKVLAWDLNTDPRAEDDTVTVRMFTETRAQSAIVPATGAGTAEASIIATVDNLIAYFDGQEILSDDFNDNDFDNKDINYSARLLRAGRITPINDLPADNKFTTAYLDGKRLYNVFQEDNEGIIEYESATFEFISTTMSGQVGLVDSITSGISSTYTINEDGYLITQFDDEGTRFVRIIETSSERLTLCWRSTLADVSANDCTGGRAEYFYFDKSKAQTILDQQPQTTPKFTTALLTQNPLYMVEEDGECNGKFTFKVDGTVDINYLDNDGSPVTENFNYGINTEGQMFISFTSPQVYTLISEPSDVFNMSKFSSGVAPENINGFKNYADAIAYGATQGNANCSDFIPE